MECPRCRQDNPPQAKFCLKCGAGVTLTCLKCSTELPVGAGFCFACGQPVGGPSAARPRFGSPDTYTPKHLAEKILTSRSALEGERKQVTVLFADMKGSMELQALRGLPHLQQGAALHESMGIKTQLSWQYLRWAEGLLLAGKLQEAGRTADRALELATAAGERGFEAGALYLLGEIASRPDPPDAQRAEDHYRRARALADGLGMRPLLAHCHLGLGKLYRRIGKGQDAQEHLTTAMAMYRNMDMRFWLEQAQSELEHVGA